MTYVTLSRLQQGSSTGIHPPPCGNSLVGFERNLHGTPEPIAASNSSGAYDFRIHIRRGAKRRLIFTLFVLSPMSYAGCGCADPPGPRVRIPLPDRNSVLNQKLSNACSCHVWVGVHGIRRAKQSWKASESCPKNTCLLGILGIVG